MRTAVVIALCLAPAASFAPAPRHGAARVVSRSAKVEKGDGGLDFITLKDPSGASAQIYLFGGDVTSYKDASGTEWIANRPDAKWDGSKPISGGLSHCFPQFGPDDDQLACKRGVQQHGFARNVDWKLVSSTESSATLSLEPSEYTEAMWDAPFKVTFTVSVTGTSLDCNVNVANTGKAEFDFQHALHSYFDVSSISGMSVGGSFFGALGVDRMKSPHEFVVEENEELKITEETDKLYPGVCDAVLKDSGKGKALKIVNGAGFKDTVLWNPYGNEAMGADKFVCVESAALNPVALAPGADWSGTLSLVPTSL